MTISASDFSDLMKEFYSPEAMKVAYSRFPILALLQEKGVSGKTFPQPIQIAGNANFSSTVANAQSNEADPVQDSWNIAHGDLMESYGVASVDGKALALTKNKKGAYVEALRNAMERAMNEHLKILSWQAYSQGNAIIGRISSISSGVITLEQAGTLPRFVKNMKLQALDTSTVNLALSRDTATTAQAGTGYVISRSPGLTSATVTVASSGFGGSAATPSGWTTNDHLVLHGMSDCFVGLRGWLVNTDDLYGVTRNDPQLQGAYYNNTSFGVRHSIDRMLLQIYMNQNDGGAVDAVLLHPLAANILAQELGARSELKPEGGKVNFGFSGFTYTGLGGGGTVDFIIDTFCPPDFAFAINKSSWDWLVPEGLSKSHVVEDDGLEKLRSATADSVEVRFRGFNAVSCKTPAMNGAAAMPSFA